MLDAKTTLNTHFVVVVGGGGAAAAVSYIDNLMALDRYQTMHVMAI